MMSRIQFGDRVRIEYGPVGANAAAGKRVPPRVVEFHAGASDMVPTLSWGVVGMIPGQRKQFTLQPGEAFGTVQPRLIRELPRYRFRKGLDLQVGQRLTAVGGISGERRRVTVVAVTPYSVTVDGNHPLAGKAVVVEIQVVSALPSTRAPRGRTEFDLGGEG